MHLTNTFTVPNISNRVSNLIAVFSFEEFLDLVDYFENNNLIDGDGYLSSHGKVCLLLGVDPVNRWVNTDNKTMCIQITDNKAFCMSRLRYNF